MTVKNGSYAPSVGYKSPLLTGRFAVAIVIVPSFRIPTPLVSNFILDYESCFTAEPPDEAIAAPIVAQLRSEPPPVAAAEDLETSRRQILGGVNGGPSLSAGPDSSIHGSFGEASAPRDLGEIRRELRNELGHTDLREAISRPMPAMPTAATTLQSRSRSRDSPSPASRAYGSAASMRTTPPLNEDALYSNGNGSGHFVPQSSTSSSPNSSNAPAGRAWDSPSIVEGGPSTSRRAKRESTMMGMTGSLGHLPKPPSLADASEPRKKSSYSRLKENIGIGSSREG